MTSVYLIKTGQGGSRIAQWDGGGPYWSRFLQRTDAATALVPGVGAATDGANHGSYAGYRDTVVPAMVTATRL